MKGFGKMKLEARLVISFLLVACVSVLVGGLGVMELHQADQRTGYIFDSKTMSIQLVSHAYAKFELIRAKNRDALLAETPAELEEARHAIETNTDSIDVLLGHYSKLMESRQDSDRYDGLVKARAAYHDALGGVLSLVKQGRMEEAKGANRAAAPTVTAYDEAISAILDANVREAAAAAAETHRATTKATVLLLIFVVVGFCAALFLGVLVTRQLVRQLGGEPDHAVEVVQKIAEGDLTVKVELREGDSSSLLYFMKEMCGKLLATMKEIHEGAESLASSSEELSATSEEMSAQAIKLQEAVSYFRIGTTSGTRIRAMASRASRPPMSKRSASPSAGKLSQEESMDDTQFERF